MITWRARARLFAAAALALVLSGGSASAQQYLPAAAAQLASGVEGGGKLLQRARTRMRLGLELRIDETQTLFGVGIDANIVSASLKAIVSGLHRSGAMTFAPGVARFPPESSINLKGAQPWLTS